MDLDFDSFTEIAKKIWKEEWSEINKFIVSRKIPILFHFTPIENLASILETGLMSRQELTTQNITFKPTDNMRLDGITSGTCFSITKPNLGLLRQKRNISQNNIVVLECAANTLLLYPFVAFPGNAASGAFANDKSENTHRYTGINGLKNLYLNKSLRTKYTLNINEPTDNQSEIIFLENIAVNRILRVHVPGGTNFQAINEHNEIIQETDTPDFHFPCDCDFLSNGYVPFAGVGRFSFDWFSD